MFCDNRINYIKKNYIEYNLISFILKLVTFPQIELFPMGWEKWGGEGGAGRGLTPSWAQLLHHLRCGSQVPFFIMRSPCRLTLANSQH